MHLMHLLVLTLYFQADMRSWSTTKEFLMEAFGELTFESSPPSTLTTSAVNYTDIDGTELRGYLAKPVTTSAALLPAIVIIQYVNFCAIDTALLTLISRQ